MSRALVDPLQVLVENNSIKKLHLRLVANRSSGPPNSDYPPLAPNSTARINITQDRPWRLFGATDCSFDSSGRLKNCLTGNCEQGGCTLEDRPIATMLAYDNRTLKPTTAMGYNLGFDGKFQCSGCPTFTCVIPLQACPKNLTISNNSGSIVGCKPGPGFPSGEDCSAPPDPYSHLPSHGITRPFDNAILKLSFR